MREKEREAGRNWKANLGRGGISIFAAGYERNGSISVFDVAVFHGR